jgi:membrane protein involved in colicin uptake
MSETVAESGPPAPEVGAEGGEAGDITPPESQNWWQFGAKEDAEAWANNLVTKRLSRERKANLDPIIQERDTLKAEVDRLRPLEDATKTDAERWSAERDRIAAENAELKKFKASREHADLIRKVAEEEGLPSNFIPRVQGADEDAIRDDIKDLLNVLSEGGSNTGKKTPPAKAPKPQGASGGSVSSGGGSSTDESDDDLSKSILEQVNQRRRNGGLSTTRR